MTLNKNDSVEGIRTSHLGFLLSKMENKEEGQMWCYKFTKILEEIKFTALSQGGFINEDEVYALFEDMNLSKSDRIYPMYFLVSSIKSSGKTLSLTLFMWSL